MRNATIAIAMTVLLPACAGQTHDRAAILPQTAAARPHPLVARSWMKSNTSGSDLIYVSNADGEVTVYDYATMNLVGVLADFETPTGECVDKVGNVYIIDVGKDVIREYAHGAAKPFKTLNASPYLPNACSVDPSTGNLAVANSSEPTGMANVAVYTTGSGEPTLYTDSHISNFLACAYNSSGLLFVSGPEGSYGGTNFAWLSKQLHKLIDVKVPGPNGSWKWYVSGMQWDGKFFALDYYGIYRIALIHGQAYYVGETSFNSRYINNKTYAIYDPNPQKQGTQVLVGYDLESYSSGVDYIPYPAGGSADGSFSHGVDLPNGIVVSLKLKQ